MKFQPQQFAAGTVFEIEFPFRCTDSPIFTSSGKVFRNGTDSYVVETTTKGKVTDFASYNLEHVKRIIKSGNGTLKISYNGVMWDDSAAYVKEMARIQNDLREVNVRRRTHYVFYNPELLIQLIVHKTFGGGHYVLDVNKMTSAFSSQTFVRSVVLSEYFTGDVAPKKRADKWIRQNFSRFLVPIKLSVKLEQQAEQEYYEREMNREEGTMVLDVEPALVDSHYGDDDWSTVGLVDNDGDEFTL